MAQLIDLITTEKYFNLIIFDVRIRLCRSICTQQLAAMVIPKEVEVMKEDPLILRTLNANSSTDFREEASLLCTTNK